MGVSPRQPVGALLGWLAQQGVGVRHPDRLEEYLLLYPLPQLLEYLPEARKSKRFRKRSKIYLEELFPLFQFDRELRLLLWPWVDRVERIVKNRLGNLLLELGEDSIINLDLYSNHSNYCNSLRNLLSDLGRRNKGKFIQCCPLEGIEYLTFGGLAHWIENLKPKYQKKLGLEFGLRGIGTLPSLLHNLRLLRNHCAHQSRLWNKQLPISYRISLKSPLASYFDSLKKGKNGEVKRISMKLVHSAIGLEYLLVESGEVPEILKGVEELRQKYSISPGEIGIGKERGLSYKHWRKRAG